MIKKDEAEKLFTSLSNSEFRLNDKQKKYVIKIWQHAGLVERSEKELIDFANIAKEYNGHFCGECYKLSRLVLDFFEIEHYE